MATYIVKNWKKITRQEGNTADIVFIIPNIIPLSNAAIKFTVVNACFIKVIEKNNSGMVIEGQKITIPLLENDTKSKDHICVWQLDVTKNNETITIGKGDFVIIKNFQK